MRKIDALLYTFFLLIVSGCSGNITEPGSELPDFEITWQTADRSYTHFELKGIDWDEVYQRLPSFSIFSQNLRTHMYGFGLAAKPSTRTSRLEASVMKGPSVLTLWRKLSPALFVRRQMAGFASECLKEILAIFTYQLLTIKSVADFLLLLRLYRTQTA